MRTLGRLVVAGMLMVGGLASAASPNDFQLYQLGNPATYPTSNASFGAFARELGASLTASNLMPPGTLGHDGFNISAELSTVFLQAANPNPAVPLSGGAVYFPTASPGFSSRMPLLLPSIHVRKGLPFSLEVGARVTYFDRSQMVAATGEVRWAALEGFASLPDITVRGFGTKLFNAPNLDLNALGIDVGVGKRFAIGGMFTLTPYVGWNLVWVGATTGLIDFDPSRSYASSVATPADQVQTNYAAYSSVRRSEAAHNRFYAGLRFLAGAFQLGVEGSYAALGQIALDDSSSTKVALPAVLAANATLGLDF